MAPALNVILHFNNDKEPGLCRSGETNPDRPKETNENSRPLLNPGGLWTGRQAASGTQAVNTAPLGH
jgi:hypothetical protein